MALEVNDINANLTLTKQAKIVPKCNSTTSDPGSTDDVNAGWDVGDVWVNTSSDTGFTCLDNTVSAAVWKETTSTGSVITIVKATLETVASSETLQDDDELKFAVLNGETWAFEFTLIVSEDLGNPNIKLRLAAAGGLTGTIEYGFIKFGTTASGNISDFTTDSGAIALDTSKDTVVVTGSVKATANGTLQLQWAQHSSDVDKTNVHALSKVVASKV